MTTLTFRKRVFDISDLSVLDAQRLIDDVWEEQFQEDDEDRTWVWKDIAGKTGYFVEAKRIQIQDQETIEAAVSYETNGISFLEEDEGAIYISRLAVAPSNRYSARTRELKYIGTLVIKFVVLRSLNLGFKGRILLEPLPASEDFYLNLGFIKVGYDDDIKYFELPANKAEELLEGFEHEEEN